jgi:hypothetical protein
MENIKASEANNNPQLFTSNNLVPLGFQTHADQADIEKLRR